MPTRSPDCRFATPEPTSGDGADDFVAGDEWVLADAPVVVDEVDVRMADAAVGDLYLDVVGFRADRDRT